MGILEDAVKALNEGVTTVDEVLDVAVPITEENFYERLEQAKEQTKPDSKYRMFELLRKALLKFPPSRENDRRQDALSFTEAEWNRSQR